MRVARIALFDTISHLFDTSEMSVVTHVRTLLSIHWAFV